MTQSAASAITSTASGGIHVAGKVPDRHFKYWIIAPAIFLLLLVGLFPLI